MINLPGRHIVKIHLLVGLFVFVATTQGQETSPEVSGTSSPRGTESKKQSIAAVEPSLPGDFLGLADLRAKTNSDIANLERQIKDLEETDIPKAQVNLETTTALKQEVVEMEQKASTDPKDLERLSSMKGELRYRSTQAGPKPEALSVQLVEARVLVERKRELATKIQSKIASMLSPEQEFKRTMSITFAALIACVIIGFFAVSFRDDKIRQAIFSGEAGIQFLTLFSLVIAIILFGITQILEGKELAALLGGLSGYILGRSTPKAATP